MAAALLTGCGGSSSPAGSPAAAGPVTPQGTSAARSPVPAAQGQAGDGRHGGRGEGGGGTTPAATWPSGVPLPSGDGLQVSAAPGAWMASEIVAAGLDDARASVTGLYRGAGYRLTSTAPDLVVLTGTSYTATVTLTAADHSPVRTAIVVHLAAR